MIERLGSVVIESVTPEVDGGRHPIKRVVGGKVSIDMKVDPGLLGGLIVRVGSRMIDGSVKTKLQKLQLAMKGVG